MNRVINKVVSDKKPSNNGVVVKSRLIQKEELLKDAYIDAELEKLGYSVWSFDDRKYSGYDEKEYFRCVEIATNCLENGVPIPEDVKKYMLKVKAIKEGGSNDKEC